MNFDYISAISLAKSCNNTHLLENKGTHFHGKKKKINLLLTPPYNFGYFMVNTTPNNMCNRFCQLLIFKFL